MAITDPLVLPADLVIVPVAELPAEVRGRLGAGAGDWALTRRRARAASRVVDARAAELLAEFLTASTLAEAVLRFSRARAADPEATLAEAFPLVETLLRAGFLVEEGGREAPAPWARGEEVAGFKVLELLQGYEDVEVYLVSRPGPPPIAPDLRAPGGLARSHESHAVLKVARPAPNGGEPAGNRTLVREAAALAHLGGGIAPRLLAAGELAGRRWLALEWCPGTDAAAAAAELRLVFRPGSSAPISPALPAAGVAPPEETPGVSSSLRQARSAEEAAIAIAGRAGASGGGRKADRAGLLALACAVAETYAALHARGLLHGDVHPRNVRVGPRGEVRLLDFGLARSLGGGGPLAALGEPGRGGVAFYLEPEYAAAARKGRRPPPATPAGEQHAVAALLYLLLAGAHALDFSLEKAEMLRQIAEEPPLPFAARGAEPWPEVEAVLARALAKDPAERFASMADLAVALAAVPAATSPAAVPPGAAPARVSAAAVPAVPSQTGVPDLAAAPGRSQEASAPEPRATPRGVAGSGPGPAARALLARTLAHLSPPGDLFAAGLPAPRASVRAGAAGIACGLYRIAMARDDAELLALADLWSARASADAGEGAFDGPGLPPERVGRVSPYHALTGPPVVAALVAHARGDLAARRAAIDSFLASATAGNTEAGNLRAAAAVSSLVAAGTEVEAPARERTGQLAAGTVDATPALARGLTDQPAAVTVDATSGDFRAEVSRSLAAAHPGAGDLDFTLGRTGLLAAGALLLDLLPPAEPQCGRLLAVGEELLAELWRQASALPPAPGREALPAGVEGPGDSAGSARAPSPDLFSDPAHASLPSAPLHLNLGIAHGWAGLLWATLRWCAAAGAALPPGVSSRLAELAGLAEPRGRGLCWPWHTRDGRTRRAMPGWCNGSAGFVHLWTLAWRATGDPAHRALAEGTAWDAWEHPDRDPTLCCGLAGRAYALLHLWRHGGAGEEWLARAGHLAERAAEEAVRRGLRPHGLYQGEVGIAVLAADLECPQDAAMPFFEEEGWGATPAGAP